MAETTAVDVVRCGAKKRQGSGTCRNVAGFKTNHVGEGRCFLHGGRNPVKHGRWSTVRHERLRDLADQHAKDVDPLNLLPELAMLRALFQDFIERYDENREALLAWHASWKQQRSAPTEEQRLALSQVLDEWENALGEEGENATPSQVAALAIARGLLSAFDPHDDVDRPRQVLDLASAHQILETISRVVKRIEDARAANAISRPELYRVISEMGRVVDQCVPDPAARAKIAEGWNAIAF